MKCKLLIVSCLISSFAFGCVATKHKIDGYEYQPLVKPPSIVTGVLESKPPGPVDIGKSTYDNSINWEVDVFKKYNSETVIGTCEAFLAEKNCQIKKISISKESLPDNYRYPWLRYENAVYSRSVVYDDVPSEERKYLTGKTYLNANGIRIAYKKLFRDEGYAKIKNIICLEPVVIVILNGAILHFDESFSVRLDREAIESSVMWSNELYDRLILRSGYAYGTRMPHAPNPQWFSPDIKIAPQSVDIDADGVGHIPVPWGELVLTKENDDWVVTAKTKE